MTEKWVREQPLDLRVKSVTKRDTKPYDRDIQKVEDKNRILASLLKQSSESKSRCASYKNEDYYESSIGLRNDRKHDPPLTKWKRPEHTLNVTSVNVSNSFRIKDGFEKSPAPLEEQDDGSSDEISVVFDKNPRSQIVDETDWSNFVPNYRKFYSRCYNKQPSNPTSIKERSSEQRPVEPFRPIPRRPPIIHHKLSLSYQNEQLKWILDDHDATSTHNDEIYLDRHSHKKDEILKCLLANSVNNSPYENSNYFLQYAAANKKWLCSKSEMLWRLENSRRYFRSLSMPRGYYSDIIGTKTADGILKSLLVPGDKKPDPSPFDAGSPGSESTSSGSTDSGVFSDIISDENKRVARGLSGKYIKSGTGASITTLKLLRQVIIERRKRNDRQL